MFRRIENREIKLSEIAQLVGGSLIGNKELAISGVVPIEEFAPNKLSLLTGKSRKVLNEVIGRKVNGALLISKAVDIKGLELAENPEQLSLIVVDHTIPALAKVVSLFYEPALPERAISPQAVIDPSATIGKDVSIAPFCWIGPNSVIEDNVTIFPQVSIYPGARIGKNSVIHAGAVVREGCKIGAGSTIQNGAVIGSDGFGYFPSPTGLKPVPQVGSVTLADGVDVGANSCIDRATLGNTSVGTSTKIDNLVQIGHNVQIGQQSIVCGQAGIAGSSKLGNGVVLGGAAGVADHINIGDGCRFAARSGIIRDYPERGDYAGLPAIPASEWLRQATLLAQLPGVLKKLKRGKA